jgi:hypothetical protein
MAGAVSSRGEADRTGRGEAATVNTTFTYHEEAAAAVGATPPEVFAFVDDHRRLSAHMESSSLMMAGSSLRVETDDRRGQAVGSHIRLSGRVLGLRLALDEVVTDYEPPLRKAWQTVGEPRLLLIGGYRMGFDIDGTGPGGRVRIWIDYDLPASGAAARWLGRLLGRFYAKWCTEQMLRACREAFGA